MPSYDSLRSGNSIVECVTFQSCRLRASQACIRHHKAVRHSCVLEAGRVLYIAYTYTPIHSTYMAGCYTYGTYVTS